MTRNILVTMTMLSFCIVPLSSASTWNLDNTHTQIGFKVRHMGLANVNGYFSTFEGMITYDPEDLSKTEVNVTIDAASINTGIEKRDEHLKSPDFFDVQKYPNITFASKSVKKSGDGMTILGDLTIHGVTKEVMLEVETLSSPLKDMMGMLRMGASAKATIDRTDFGLEWNAVLETGSLLIGKEVRIQIEAELIQK